MSLSNPSGAVFLSYSSEDAGAAENIANALSATGIEVWFDKSALRGGDAWDRLERAIQQRDGGMVYLRHDRCMTSLRTDPRDPSLLRMINLD